MRDRRFLGLLGLNTLVWFAGYQVFAIVPLHLRGMGASLAGSGRFAAFLTLGTASGALLMGRLGDRDRPPEQLAADTEGDECPQRPVNFSDTPPGVVEAATNRHGERLRRQRPLVWTGSKTATGKNSKNNSAPTHQSLPNKSQPPRPPKNSDSTVASALLAARQRPLGAWCAADG